MTKEIEKEQVDIECPRCSEKIDIVWVCTIESVIGLRYAYFCSKCQRMLGIFLSKGFTTEKLNAIREESTHIN
ncbi:MAG: hypothetical protein Kow0098_02770 [Ignavibacteriaceae bacterium]